MTRLTGQKQFDLANDRVGPGVEVIEAVDEAARMAALPEGFVPWLSVRRRSGKVQTNGYVDRDLCTLWNARGWPMLGFSKDEPYGYRSPETEC